MQPETTSISINQFKLIIQECVDYMLKRSTYTPRVLKLIGETLKTSSESYYSLIEEKGYRKKAEGVDDISKEELEVPVSDLEIIREMEYASASLAFISNRLLEMTFLDSIVSFDVFLMKLFRRLFEMFPDTLNNSQLTYKDLLSIQNVEQARATLIDEKIDELFRKSHIDQIESLEKQFSIYAKSNCEDLFKSFIEITERRNVLIHCDGVVSRQYENVCRSVGLKDIAPLGTKLIIDEKYFINACDILLSYVIIIGYGTWRIKEKPNSEAADAYLLDLCNLLCEYSRYDVINRIVEFVTKIIKPQPKRLMAHQLKLYQIFALKQIGNEELAKALIDAEDWTSVDIKIQLQLYVVLQQYDDAYGLMKSVDSTIFSTCEILRDFIKTQKFHETYQRIKGVEFKLSRHSMRG